MANKHERFGAVAERHHTIQIIKKFLGLEPAAKAIYEEIISRSVDDVIEDRKQDLKDLKEASDAESK